MEWVTLLLDSWTAAGGTLLDCAHNYGEGRAERAVGLWMRARGNRADMVLLTKGGHPDESGGRVNPAAIAQDLDESLLRLGTSHVDIYLLHRDDESVPVDEIVDALDAEFRAGRVLTVGVSNWRHERIHAANGYAVAHGREPIRVSSPHLSLARQTEPPWPGCVSAASVEERRFYADHDIVVMPWSPQAGGFFAAPDRLSQQSARVYDTAENRERLRRVHLLSEKHLATTTQVALAWVMASPFCVIPVVGALSTSEIRDSVAALDIHLDAGDVAWLDLETDVATLALEDPV